MSKYINIVLVSIFGVLSISYNMALTFFIPFICYYSYKNINNLFLIIPFSLVSVYFFSLNIYLILFLFYITLCTLLIIIQKNKKIIYIIIYSLLINIITYYIYINNYNIITNIYYDLLSIVIAPIILLFLLYNNETYDNINKGIRSIAYNEVILAFVITIFSSKYKIYSISVSFLIAIYFCMYLSSNKYIFSSLFYCFITMFLFNEIFNIENNLILLGISLIYLIPNLFSTLVLIVFLLYTLYLKYDLFDIYIYYVLGIISFIFEIFRPFIINNYSKIEVINNVYERTISQIDIELESFSLFLDKIAKNIKDNEYNEELGEAISKLSYVVCGNCEKKSECFRINKGKIYYYLKNCLLNNSDDFICHRSDIMKKNARLLNNNLINKKAYINDLLYPLLSTTSNILRQYKLDHNINSEIDFDILNNLKEGLMNYGYSISLFNVIRTFQNDYIIEVGIIGICFFDEKKHIENVSSHFLKSKSSAVLKDIKKNKTYVTIIPKTNYEIIYGYGSLSKIGNSICGDNYLIKNLSNKKLMAVICDGMGKGLNANIVSSRTLKLLDEITNTNISSETSLQILNSLFYIQDYQENYTTMDFIEIDKNTGEMILYKAGATYTYIIRESGEMIKIENENLPFGLNELVLIKKFNLQNNDLVLLSSDGIFDNIINMKEFENFIITIKNMEPQKISYELLNYARNTDLISKDDMSIIALKVKLI